MSGLHTDDEFVRKLPCKLTAAELEERLHEAKTAVDEIATLAGEVADLKKEAKEKQSEIDAKQRRINDLAKIADAGEEERDVPCHYRYLIESNAVELVRLDTSDIVEQRAMTAEERQQQLDFGAEAEEGVSS